MKQIVAFFILICLTLNFSVYAADSTINEQQPQKINVSRKDTHIGVNPHSISAVPMEVYYCSSLSALMISFNYNVGIVETSVTNVCNGESVECQINSQVGTAFVPVPDEIGHYSISIYLPNGTEYYGEFDIE
ncbi:MAG: hypothetical protein ACI3ZO_02730 [Candidatus Cryptobacteroides sp.]|nr:hypothetical protein [Bacteroidales bacterium]